VPEPANSLRPFGEPWGEDWVITNCTCYIRFTALTSSLPSHTLFLSGSQEAVRLDS